jgi:hypothetical protein
LIQATLQTDKGPIGIIGINHENWRRLHAGMPLDIDIKSMTPPGTRMNRVVIHYAHTYEDVVKDLSEGGFDIPDEMREEAKKMDATLARERRQRGANG